MLDFGGINNELYVDKHVKGKTVGWFLNQFESTELMGTLSIESAPDPEQHLTQ